MDASSINEVILTLSIPTFWKQSIGDIYIINITDTTCSYIDNQPFHCTYLNSAVSTTLIDNFKIYTANTEKYTSEKFIKDSNFSTNFPSNRSLYIDYINNNVKCIYIKYKLGSFLILCLLQNFHLYWIFIYLIINVRFCLIC